MTGAGPGHASGEPARAQLERFLVAGPEALAARLPRPEIARLLAECRAALPQPERPVLRTLHHFACTGGTLFSKAIAALPCTRLLSEVDPFSELGYQMPFAPRDLISLAKAGSNPPGQAVLARIFRAGLAALEADTRAEGRDLVLRDHSHSHFCTNVATGSGLPQRPSMKELLAADYRLLSLVSVRHPLDSWLSLQRQDWVHFAPATLEEYARRYHLFLDHYAGTEILCYEAFIAAPDAGMRKICQVLELPASRDFQQRIAALSLSGDSGRSGAVIAARPRRAVPEAVLADLAQAPTYDSLCARLGYDPDPHAPPWRSPASRMRDV
ncbi:sulfotransferase family protein [Leisingera sp. ANG59]|uniref:sulfotransferase family protein n=1 Tax=Leisingera sp. ANG59 TaxID=2675221 RepID=UPI001572D2C2|nr:sulfotransferase family protein [Leisingera sp. ANG59]NSY39548.1 sulfotransferase family protein [Leisingera sp. ANG59]